jgi:hypothetical protein
MTSDWRRNLPPKHVSKNNPADDNRIVDGSGTLTENMFVESEPLYNPPAFVPAVTASSDREDTSHWCHP